MGRRLRCLALALAMWVGLSLASPGTAAALTVEQVKEQMPRLNLFFYEDDYDLSGLTAGEIQAWLGEEALAVQRFCPAAESGVGAEYVYMLDISGSMPDAHFAAAKELILSQAEALGEQDSLSVITFGDTVTLHRALSFQEAEALLAGTQNRDSTTHFYAAMDRLLEYAAGDKLRRTVAVVFSDGVDDTDAGMTRQELEQALQGEGVSISALCIDTAGQAAVDDFGAFVRATGGDIYLYNARTAQEVHAQLQARLGQCWYLELASGSNIADGSAAILRIHLGDAVAADIPVTLTAWQPDETAPAVTAAGYDPDGSSIRVWFSEAVLGAGDPAAFTLTGPDGSPVALTGAKYQEEAGSFFTDLLPESIPASGTYTLTIRGVTDASMEKNPLSESAVTLELDTGVRDSALVWIILGAAAVAAVLALALVLLIRRKKAVPPAEEGSAAPEGRRYTDIAQIHIPKGEGIRLSVRVNDGHGTVTETELILVDTLTLGRSPKQCGVVFDDPKMGRRHCRILAVEGGLALEDLGSVNGTSLNGRPLGPGPHKLQPGDKFTMGDTTVYLLSLS